MDEKQKDEYIAYLEKIIALMPGNIYWKDRQGKYLGCNANAAKIALLTGHKDIVGKYLHDFLDQKYADILAITDERIMSNDKEEMIEEAGPNTEGKPAIYLTRKIPLHNDAGEVTGLLGTSFDITERKQMEEELKKTQEQLKTSLEEKTRFIENMSYLENIISLIPGNVYWKDRQGHYLGCNENVAKILKLPSRAAIAGKTNTELLGAEYAAIVAPIDHEVIALNTEKALEEPGFDIEGTPATYLTKKVPLHNEEGTVIGLLGISIDITAQKKIEQELRDAKEHAEAASKAKSEFLAMLSHELRIPLTGILGMAQLMQLDDELPPQYQDTAADIIKSGDHLLALVDDLLDISKLEANKIELVLAPTDFNKLVEEVATTLASRAQQQDLELLTYYEENVPHLVIGDARALRQILLNLIGNAVKFTKTGYVLVKVSCTKQTSTQATLKLSVIDTGIGIPQNKLEAIFERFSQADTSITRKYGGTGLGLAIAKAYLELMHGSITVHSEVNKGSIFTCMIPLQLQTTTTDIPSHGQEVENIMDNANTTIAENQKPKILLVEDDAIVAKVHLLMLEKIGCAVERATSGMQAVVMAENNFDLIFMDIGLPDISGYEATQQIREYQKNNTHQYTPIIGLTGYGHEEYKTKCLEAGMNAVATKPIKLIELKQLLEHHLV